MAEETPVPCTISGEVEDEVILEFPDDGDKQLYVSKSFLCYISPVFKAMFSEMSAFKEQKENKITMNAKKYDDILEFLLHFHPKTRKPITSENVFTLVPLLDEYMNENSVEDCNTELKNMVARYSKRPNHEESIRETLKILHLALDFSYKDVKVFVIKKLSVWETDSWKGRNMYNHAGYSGYIFQDVPEEGQTNTCRSLYQSLPDSIKTEVLENRLILKESDLFYRLIQK